MFKGPVLARKMTPHLHGLREGILHRRGIKEDQRYKIHMETRSSQCLDLDIISQGVLHQEVGEDKMNNQWRRRMIIHHRGLGRNLHGGTRISLDQCMTHQLKTHKCALLSWIVVRKRNPSFVQEWI